VFIKSAQGSEACDAAIDSISKPISAINACAASALAHLDQSSWMQRTFGSISRTFVGSIQDAIARCCDIISHLVSSVESHLLTPNSYFETNTLLPFIIEQCYSALHLLRNASAACDPTPGVDSAPHPIDFSHIVSHCVASVQSPHNANLMQEHSSLIKFCSLLSQSVLQMKSHFTLPVPPNSAASEDVSRAALAAQAVVSQIVELNRSVCKVSDVQQPQLAVLFLTSF
jgi:hypothetical protein